MSTMVDKIMAPPKMIHVEVQLLIDDFEMEIFSWLVDPIESQGPL